MITFDRLYCLYAISDEEQHMSTSTAMRIIFVRCYTKLEKYSDASLVMYTIGRADMETSFTHNITELYQGIIDKHLLDRTQFGSSTKDR